MLTTPEVHEIMTSRPAIDGQRALFSTERCTDTQNLTVAQYAAARDYLIMSLTRTVGPRPGALETVTIGQWKAARWDVKYGTKVLLMMSHKREVDGPVPIPCSKKIAKNLEVFVTKLRPLVCTDSSDSGKLFLKSDGAPYQKGTIGHKITALVLKSGVCTNRPISATDLRLFMIMKTKKRAGLPINEGLLQRLTCHSEQTAQTW